MRILLKRFWAILHIFSIFFIYTQNKTFLQLYNKQLGPCIEKRQRHIERYRKWGEFYHLCAYSLEAGERNRLVVISIPSA